MKRSLTHFRKNLVIYKKVRYNKQDDTRLLYLKRRMKRLLLIACCSLFMFTGCGKSSPEGKYSLKAREGQSIEEGWTLELRSDGSALAEGPDEDSVEGTWTQSGDKVTLTLDDDVYELTYKDGELSNDELLFVK